MAWTEPLNDLLSKIRLLIIIAVDWGSSKKHKIEWLVLMLFNNERLQQTWWGGGNHARKSNNKQKQKQPNIFIVPHRG